MTIILEAAELKFALEQGFSDLSEAKAWADQKILDSEIANTDIIDLALARTTSEAISSLGNLSSRVEIWRVLRQFFKRFLSVKKIDLYSAQRLAEYLYYKTCYDENCPKDMKIFYHHYPRIDGAIEGWGQESKEEALELLLNDIKSIAIKAP